jgi:hypothetical protein
MAALLVAELTELVATQRNWSPFMPTVVELTVRVPVVVPE